MKTVNVIYRLLVCSLVLILTGCLATQPSSSSSSSSMPSSQSSQSSPTASSSSSSSSAQQDTQRQRSRQGEYGGRDSGYNESTEQTSGGTVPTLEGMPEGMPGSDSDSVSTMGDEPPAYESDPYGETSSHAGGGQGGEILSEEEALEALDAQFDESIAVFDGMIINERAAAQAASDAFSEEDGEFGDDLFDDSEPLFEEADITEDSDGQGASSNDEAEQGGASHGQDEADRGTGTMASRSDTLSTGRQGANIPSDIPDGSDDDIVARQIREAAMKETDPELREKLWEEYRKYKEGQ